MLRIAILQAAAGGSGDLSLPSLGVAGVAIVALISFFVWQNKNISNGKWVPKIQVDERLAEKDRAYDKMVVLKDDAYANMVTEKDSQIEAERATKGEWHGAWETSEKGRTEERTTTAAAVDTVRSFGQALEASATNGSKVAATDTQTGDKR